MKKYGIFIFLMMFIFILSSCSTTGLKNLGTKVNSTDRFWSTENKGLKVELRYLSEQSLVKKYGRINNPFISPVSFLESNKLNTFSISVENRRDEAVVIVLKSIEIQFNGRTEQPFNPFQLTEFWRPRIEKQREYQKWNMSLLETKIKKYCMNDKETVKPGGKIERLLVFKGKLPTYGEVNLYIPVMNTGGERIYLFNFSINR